VGEIVREDVVFLGLHAVFDPCDQVVEGLLVRFVVEVVVVGGAHYVLDE